MLTPANDPLSDRLPPHDLNAEACLLASLMLSGQNREIIAETRVPVEAFYRADNGVIYRAILDLWAAGKPIDAVVLRSELERRQVFEEVGGSQYLVELLNGVPSAANAMAYSAIVREKWLLREGIGIAEKFIRAAYKPTQSDVAVSVLGDLARNAADLAATGKEIDIVKVGTAAFAFLDDKENGADGRIPTGLVKVDELVGGLRRAGKTIVGGRPGHGKSTFIRTVALNIARRGIPVGIVSVEEDRQKIATNMLSRITRIDNRKVAFGEFGVEDWTKVQVAAGELESLPLYVCDSARKLSEIEASATLLATRYKCQVIAVDHLHLVDSEGGETREREISRISAGLKWLWRRLNVAGLEAAQLNRAMGREEPPTLANLRDSGSLEQDGDVIVLMHRPDAIKREKNYIPTRLVDLHIAKNKDGQTGVVTAGFNAACQEILDDGPASAGAEQVSEEEINF